MISFVWNMQSKSIETIDRWLPWEGRVGWGLAGEWQQHFLLEC